MTSSNKARRYLQLHKQNSSESPTKQSSPVQSSIVESTSSSAIMRKFRGKTQPQSPSIVSIPQICLNHNDDDHGHISILNDFDEILENEAKHTVSLKQSESTGHIGIPISQQRSFSFSLGSKTSLHKDDEATSTLSSKMNKPSATLKPNSSKETFSRLFHSLTFRSGKDLTSKLSVLRTDSSSQQQSPCIACQNYSHLDIIPKHKKRPSIFGVLASKLSTTAATESTLHRCTVCKRLLSKFVSNNDDNQQLSSSKSLRDSKQLLSRTKRRQSLPSLFHNLLEPSSIQRRPSFSVALTDNRPPEQQQQQQAAILSQSSISLIESEDSDENNNSFKRQSTYNDNSSQQTEKSENQDENDNEIIIDNSESYDLNSMNSIDSTNENNPNQQKFLHPPEEKTRSLLINVFRTRRSNAGLTANEANIVNKQFSASVINLATSNGMHRRNSTIATVTEPTLDSRKHALSEENLPSLDKKYIYFTDSNGQHCKEKLKYSTTSENTMLREMLIKLFGKHHLSIETSDICLRSAPTLPLSLNQPVKHLLLDDLVVTETINRAPMKTSTGKDKSEKRNSIGSTTLHSNSKLTSKRLSSICMMVDNDDNHHPPPPNRSNKTSRSSIFTSSSADRSETNQSFIRRKCDEWLTHGLPKLAQLQCSIDQSDLNIEKEWQPFLTEQARLNMSETTKLQQEAIYEMLSTEVSYIRQISTMTDVFMTSVSILKSSQRDGIFHDIDMERLFSNIQEVLHANLVFWKEIFLPMKCQLEQHGSPINPSDFKKGFLNFDVYFQSYLHYVLDQKTSAEYFKQKVARDDLFQYLITWIEANFTNRLSFSDLTIKPLQRLTRYKLLLEAIQKKTQDVQQRNDLNEMIQKVATFVNRVNSKLHNQEQEERIRQINDRIGTYDNIYAPPELTSILQEYNRDSLCNRLDLFQDMPMYVRGYRRQIIQQGPMKMKDSKNSYDVYCYLFSDLFLITKGGKRSGSTNTSLSAANNDGLLNRPSSNLINKILKPPIRIDRFDVREYDRRGGSNTNTEPNTASFAVLVFSEYNLIENAYLFQTNLSKQWIENIRTTKANFQLLMEESKIKFQNLNQSPILPNASLFTNQRHQTLSNPSSPMPKTDDRNGPHVDNRRSSKVESDVFKIVEQTRRNSRTDRKNFGRYFTADGTSTPTANPSTSSSPIKKISSSSTTILKRMSWNNDQTMDKTDSSLITNSFRSVHSSSGVSSTGSFLFSADEDPSITTTSSSIVSIVPSIKNEDFDGKSSTSTVIDADQQLLPLELTLEQNSVSSDLPSPISRLRRTPFASVKKRHPVLHQHRQEIFNTNDTTLILSESSKSTDDNLSIISSGNESDYDNHQLSTNHIPVSNLLGSTEFLHTDDLLLGDQNEIILQNDTHIENLNHPSDMTNIPSLRSTPTLQESPPAMNFLSYQKDPLTARRLLDIRSHLLLNTTLDATEV